MSVHSTAGSRGVRISGSNDSNAGYTMFWSRVQDYWLLTPLAYSPFTSSTVRHRVPSGFNWALPQNTGQPRHRTAIKRCKQLMRTRCIEPGFVNITALSKMAPQNNAVYWAKDNKWFTKKKKSRWDEIFRTSPYGPWGPSSLLYNRHRVFPEV